MSHYCAGEDCQTWVADDVEFCTECRERERAIRLSVQANLSDIEARLAKHRLFAEWLTHHPEHDL